MKTQIPGEDVRDLSLTDSDVAAANKDGLPSIPSMRTLGTGAQQACAGNDPRLNGGAGYDFFRHTGVTPFQAWYIAAQATCQNLGAGNMGTNVLRAVPLVIPRGGTIDRIIFNNTTRGVSSFGRVGIYQATSAINLYPNTRLFDSGQILLDPVGIKTVALSLPVSGSVLYWVVYVGGGSGETLRMLKLDACYPIFGVDSPFENNSPAVGLITNFAFGPLPATFPAGATFLTTTPIPAIAVRLA